LGGRGRGLVPVVQVAHGYYKFIILLDESESKFSKNVFCSSFNDVFEIP
jgi:hypothetical protein